MKKLNGTYVVKTTDQMIADGGEPHKNGEVYIGMDSWTPIMEKACPIHRHIEVVEGRWIDCNAREWCITPEMLLGPAIKPGH